MPHHHWCDVGSLLKTLVYQPHFLTTSFIFRFQTENSLLFPYGRYFWGAGFTMANTSLWWVSATLFQLLPFIWSNISANSTLHGFWSWAKKDFSNSQEIYIDICRLSHIRFSWINIILEISFCPLTPCDFPLAHKNVCTHVLGYRWYTSFGKVECHLVIEDTISFCFHGNIRELSLIWKKFSPSYSHLGRQWFIRYLHSIWYTTTITPLSLVNILADYLQYTANFS
jgi:hypothetical protein